MLTHETFLAWMSVRHFVQSAAAEVNPRARRAATRIASPFHFPPSFQGFLRSVDITFAAAEMRWRPDLAIRAPPVPST
jgi:hypothetical protein